MARIVLNTFGSFGDLHPFLAIALELQRRGHQPILAAPAFYRDKVSAEGIEFAAVRPDIGKLREQPEIIRKLWDRRRGTEFLIREMLAPQMEGAFEDLRRACQGANLLVTHTAGFAGPIVAETLHLRWLSVALQPSVFFSTFDPPVLAPAEWLSHLRPLGRWPFILAREYGRFETRKWLRPVVELRRQLGLAAKTHPLFEGQFSPYGTLALFSSHFVQPQPDWPPKVTITGFVFYDKLGSGFEIQGKATDVALDEFLAAGAPPLVFTLGSSAVMHPGSFFRESAAAAAEIGRRAVLLAGEQYRNQIPPNPPNWIFVAQYAPYSKLLPRAAVTVHQGGIGTTAQALAAGRPMLAVPWAHDQPDNAAVLERLGVSLTVSRQRYRTPLVAKTLSRVLKDPVFATTAQRLGTLIRNENGAAVASDAIEDAI
ncbi:MAG TPA: glycosyltransferase [Bryobacteraceae bacterium]|nr:glycosyltransferase [Bryobacteraceae bacterium]